MIITEDQKNALKPYIENLDELSKSDDVNGFLLVLNDVMLGYFVDDEPTDEALKLEHIYDEIYYQNEYDAEFPNGCKIVDFKPINYNSKTI